MTKDISYCVAAPGDEAGILKVFAEVAPEVPTAVRSGTKELIDRLVATNQSWIATDAAGTIIGYALAEGDDKAIWLVYLGVSAAARNQRVSSSLIARLKETGRPIDTDVRSNNTSSMVERFEHFGFVKTHVNNDRTKLRWERPTGPPA
ncbi:GNAT family N-acetyltransferase [Bradyrhizobium sp. WSM3983]|uniref:GNAT family N-acetyltransferase n=1 Tax=Bradyrhizobium sp. WSM3983 TaxID=1038867 RepID=UPI0012EC9B0F|nr:GNAT family N-acetyltransferase [Bradyrhizobium sp. WSM3983]